MMRDYYTDKVQLDETFGLDTLEWKVDSAYQYANDRPGNASYEAAALLAAEAFEGVTGENLPDNEAFEEALPESQWKAIGDFLNSPAPERDWVVEGWLPCGFSTPTLITGDGGTGKSLLAMMLAMSVAQGLPWLGFEVLKKMPVAMIMCEDSEDELHRRVEAINQTAMGAFSDLKTAEVHFMSRVGKDCVLCREDNGVLRDGPFMKELHTQLKHLGDGEKLLILDTVADIYAGNESNRTAVNQFIKYKLCGLAKIHNATIIIIAHPPKSGATYSGSTAWNNSVRNRLYLGWKDDKNKDDWRVLSVEKSNYARAGTKICLKWDSGIFTPMEAAELHEGIDELVFAHIESHNMRAEESGSMDRFSARSQAKNFIGREIIINPVTGKRIGVGEIKESVNRLIEEGKITEVRGKVRGLVCLTDYGAPW
jgi:RecA-family ATPase